MQYFTIYHIRVLVFETRRKNEEERISMLKFAHDSLPSVESEMALGKVLNYIDKLLRDEFAFKINKSRTKVMYSTRNVNQDSLNIKIASDSIREMDGFNYLDSIITNNGQSDNDIKRKVTQVKIDSYHNKRKKFDLIK